MHGIIFESNIVVHVGESEEHNRYIENPENMLSDFLSIIYWDLSVVITKINDDCMFRETGHIQKYRW